MALRFVDVVVNGPKTWSLAATLHPQVAAACDAAQDRAAVDIIGWLAAHATTRVGPRGRQVQVPVEQLEAAVVRHHTSRTAIRPATCTCRSTPVSSPQAGGAGCTRWAWWAASRRSTGSGAPRWRATSSSARRSRPSGTPSTPTQARSQNSRRTPEPSAPVPRRSPAKSAATRRSGAENHPDEEPGPALRRTWDRRAWAQARPDKVVPQNGADLGRRWVEELRELEDTPPTPLADLPVKPPVRRGTPSGYVDRDAVADLVMSRLGAVARAETPPTSVARSNRSSPRPASSRRTPCATSWPRA